MTRRENDSDDITAKQIQQWRGRDIEWGFKLLLSILGTVTLILITEMRGDIKDALEKAAKNEAEIRTLNEFKANTQQRLDRLERIDDNTRGGKKKKMEEPTSSSYPLWPVPVFWWSAIGVLGIVIVVHDRLKT